MSARYAIYLAPSADTALWRFGSAVLGYDAATGAELHGFAPKGFSPDDWRRMTERPRIYGFHGTLKAPFRLAEGATAAALLEAARALAALHLAFDAGPLAVTGIGQGGEGFVALTLQRECPELGALEQAAVEGLDRFRAPATPAEIAARRPERLTERQRSSLARFGYPFIGPDYRFHMTLSGATARPADLADELAELYATRVGAAHLLVDALVLFEQAEPDGRFRIAARCPLALPPARATGCAF